MIVYYQYTYNPNYIIYVHIYPPQNHQGDFIKKMQQEAIYHSIVSQ
jgi:hypothetical protein